MFQYEIIYYVMTWIKWRARELKAVIKATRAAVEMSSLHNKQFPVVIHLHVEHVLTKKLNASKFSSQQSITQIVQAADVTRPALGKKMDVWATQGVCESLGTHIPCETKRIFCVSYGCGINRIM